MQGGREVGGGGKLQEAHIQLHLAVWRDKYGSMSEAHATAGFDDYTLRRPYKHADRRWKEPTPPPHLRSQVQYRHNRNKAESLSTLEVHWSTTMAWLFINQLSFANCLLRWTERVCVAHCCISLKTAKLFDIIQLKMEYMLR